MINLFSPQPVDRPGFPSQPEDELELAKELYRRRQEEMAAAGVVFLNRGDVVKVNGIPLTLMEPVYARTAPENIPLLEKK